MLSVKQGGCPLPPLDKDRLGYFLVLTIQDYCNHENEKKEGDVCKSKLGVHKNIDRSEEKRPDAEVELSLIHI